MNKNTKKLKSQLRVARRSGKDSLTVQVPVSNYHSNAQLTGKTFAISSGGGVVSKNERRNMQMRVLSNAGGGANSSLTVHEKIRKDEPANPKPKREKKDKS